jgi:hypothetical protein
MMKKKRITVEKADITANKLLIIGDETLKDLQPAGQILVDSDNFSFIYLMEGQVEYTYIVLPEGIWPILKKALDEALPVYITYEDVHIQLSDFLEELDYVISNIKGNSNYGKEMVAKVEEIFHS